MDLIYEGITTSKLAGYQKNQTVRMDLIYEGITTWRCPGLSAPGQGVRMDLIYEGITTNSAFLIFLSSSRQNGPDLRRDYDAAR